MTDPVPHSLVLIVDDDERVRQIHQRTLARAGFAVEAAADGEAALAAIQRTSFDVVLSDIDMPGMNGIRLLERIRAHDVDVPVVFVTGAPSMETAIQALERGALRYLTKPVALEELVQVAAHAARLHQIAVAKRQALALINAGDYFAGDSAGLKVAFEDALDGLTVVYQPIVSVSTRTVHAYEALMRPRDETLSGPLAMIDAAERLGRFHDLGRRIRHVALSAMTRLPEHAALFLNLHPTDLLDRQLLSDVHLTSFARRIVLEITERGALERVPEARNRIQALRAIGFRFALDDFGAGYGGLSSFALMEPEVVKLDMGIVRGVEHETTKQALIRTITRMCSELNIDVIAEGVETVGERDAVIEAGCDLMQGYLFAYPGDLPEPTF